ncbi:MAG: YfiR/HmsC family protein [Gammaproteobacteria bacterium]
MLRFCARIGLTFLCGLVSVLGTISLAQDALSPRLQIGINLLPAIVAANQSLAATDNSRNLPIYLVYAEDRYQAEQIKPRINQVGKIRGRALEVRSISLDELLAAEPPPLSVVFIAEPLDRQLPDLVRFAQQQRLLLFSPFAGDVERGVAAGFQVTDKVLPQVNMASLKQSKIQLKAFFLRIAVKHE